MQLLALWRESSWYVSPSFSACLLRLDPSTTSYTTLKWHRNCAFTCPMLLHNNNNNSIDTTEPYLCHFQMFAPFYPTYSASFLYILTSLHPSQYSRIGSDNLQASTAAILPSLRPEQPCATITASSSLVAITQADRQRPSHARKSAIRWHKTVRGARLFISATALQ